MKKALSLLTVVLLLVAVVSSFVNLASAAPSYPEVWVDDDAPADWYDANHVDSIATAVSIVSPGGVIHVLPGTYEPSNVVWITKPLSMVGEDYPTIKGVLSIMNTENVMISGIHFTHPTNYNVLLAHSSTNLTLENNVFGPMPQGKPVYMDDVHNVLFRNNTFRDNYHEAITFEGINGNITFLGNLFVGNVKTGPPSTHGAIHIHGETAGLVLMGNVFINNSMNDILANYLTVTGMIIENNTFSGNNTETTAIWLFNAPNAIIRGNTISGYSKGIYVSQSDGVAIEDNVVASSSGLGIYLLGLKNGTVRNNRISENDYGIYLTDVTDSRVEGNDASGNAIGMYLHTATNITITHNVLLNNSGGIYLQESQDVWVYANIIMSGTQNGILLGHGTTDVNITRNYIGGYSKGIYVFDATNIEVHYNSIVGNGVGVRTFFYYISPAWVNATLNWWGAEDGPSAISNVVYHGQTPTGSGDPVGDYVYFDPWIGKTPEVTYSDLRVSKTVISPRDTITVSATVENPNEIPTGYTAELRVNGNVNETKEGVILPGESATVTFDLTLNAPGTYSVTIDGLPPVDVHVVGGSPIAIYNTYYQIAIIWTNLFFSASDDFNELYEEALNSGVDNETLKAAMEEYNESVALLLHAWNENSLEHLRRTLWNMRGVVPRIHEIRDAYMKVKEAISILESGME